MNDKKENSVSSVRELLYLGTKETSGPSFYGGNIWFSQTIIGRFNILNNKNYKTGKIKNSYSCEVHSPLGNIDSLTISIVSKTESSLLNKLAIEISKAMKNGTFELDEENK